MLSQLNGKSIASVLEAIADVQLQLDAEGYCTDASVTNPELPDLLRLPWRGSFWIDLCAEKYRDRARGAFNRALEQPGRPVRVELEHAWPESELHHPMSYRLIATDDGKQVIAIGEDLRALAELRQQLVNAQHVMEKDYWSLRQMESRYRQLLELSADALIVVDLNSLRVLEANGATSSMLADGNSLIGRPLPIENAEFDDMVSQAKASGSTVRGTVTLGAAADAAGLTTIITPLRQGTEQRLLIRIAAESTDLRSNEECMVDAFRSAPDAIVQTDGDGIVVNCNQTFAHWIQLNSPELAIGRSLDNWLGRSTVDVGVILDNLRQGKIVKLFASVLRGALGQQTDIEVSAATVGNHESIRHVLFIRDISRRVSQTHPLKEQLPRSIEQITERVGRVPLKELVRESTDIIEALCIEAALKLTNGNRASAAEMLGVSRQSLYMKLRRFEMATVPDE